MNTRSIITNLSCVAIVSVGAFAGAEEASKHYVCTACNAPCDAKVFDHPGVCPDCGMPLVEQGSAAAVRRPRQSVAILLFDGVEIIDYTGPYEMFGDADFDVFTVAETRQPVTTSMGMVVVPKFTFADAPRANVVVVPGGGVKAASDSATTLKWVADATAHAEHTMSVCNGAFILASAGLLDGLTATTTAHLIPKLKEKFPKTKVVDNQRLVDNGKIVTTGGLSSGIDGALHVIATMRGKGFAQKVALDEEYDWRPQSGFTRASLADLLIPDVNVDALGNWDLVSTQGDADHWEMVFHGTTDLSAADLVNRIDQDFSTKGRWTRRGDRSGAKGDWKFRSPDGKPWAASLTVQPTRGASREYTVTLTLVRA